MDNMGGGIDQSGDYDVHKPLHVELPVDVPGDVPKVLPRQLSIVQSDTLSGNASIRSHGWLPKLPNSTTTFLRGDGTWATPPTPASFTAVSVIQTIYPIGAIYISTLSTNPSTLLGFGTWAAFGTGRVLVSKAAAGTFSTAGATGGEETHQLITSEMPSHTHTQNSHNHTQDAHTHTFDTRSSFQGTNTGNQYNAWRDNTGGTTGSTTATNQAATATNQNTGGDGAHNNLQPYIVVFMWQRSA